MNTPISFPLDPKLDLCLERIVDLPPEKIWKAWTTPSILMEWFCPLPWKTVQCEMDLRPGGKFRTVMNGPEGEVHDVSGCFLEVIQNQRLVWTDAFGPGYRPSKEPNPCINGFFTAAILLEPHETGSLYRAIVIHGSESECEAHKKLGFHEGWGIALDQLVAHMKSL
ncbi:MAG: SRPBCC family protein [Bdellovibrionales bacterium]|nr:SRPBCC family protein [Bdellovibrionales bacterium]